MAAFPSRLLLVAALSGGLALAAPAQTARIAHLSHSGSPATLAPELDNFGLPNPTFVVDSIRLLSDTTALEYGKWHWARGEQAKEKVRTHKFSSRQGGAARTSARSYVEQQKARNQPELKVLASDTLPKPKSAPVLKKQKTKRKKAALLIMLPAEPPRPYGLWLGAACVLGLAGAGWLLGERTAASLAPVNG